MAASVVSALVAMDIGTRYEDIVDAFNSIRDDAKKMVEQIDDGKLESPRCCLPQRRQAAGCTWGSRAKGSRAERTCVFNWIR
jgi:hypothetical protein